MFFKQFGGSIAPDDTARYEQSPNWRDGQFQNLEETSMAGNIWDLPKIIYKQFAQTAGREPKQPLPVMPFDREAFLAPADKAKFIWYGHSVILMRMQGQTILIDPMLGPNTTPIAPVANKRFSENTLDLIDEFPPIDLLIMTHDHYDHLDLASIEKLKPKVAQYFVALGAKRHLVSWGVEADRITEFDWWDEHSLADIAITYTPTRHFSGRGLKDRQKCLWGGWVFHAPGEKIWFSGDGGYGQHFHEVGRRLGPFDFGFMECGQYNEDWHQIHMFPDECVQAALDAGAQKIMPVHWAGFNLSYQHTWKEPVEEFVQAAEQQSVDFMTPALGQLFQVATAAQGQWWTEFE